YGPVRGSGPDRAGKEAVGGGEGPASAGKAGVGTGAGTGAGSARDEKESAGRPSTGNGCAAVCRLRFPAAFKRGGEGPPGGSAGAGGTAGCVDLARRPDRDARG